MRRSVAPPARMPASPRAARVAPRQAAPVSRLAPPRRAGAAPCACGGGCPRCQPGAGAQDFSAVRFHASAPEITSPLRARAVTIGQDIYFHPGQYRPGTPDGDRLIDHELAHTRQARRGGEGQRGGVSQPGDALEKNADALARGETSQPLAAPAGMALRTPFDSETPDDRTRRQDLLRGIGEAQNNLIRLLQTGGILTGSEVVVERSGVRGVIVPASTLGRGDENFLSFTARDAMLRRILRRLMAMGTYYRSHPIPAELPAAVADPLDTPDSEQSYSTRVSTPTGGSVFSAGSARSTQLQAAHVLYLLQQGISTSNIWVEWFYIKTGGRITPGAARGAPRIGRGTPSGAYMVVPDIDNDPLRYWHLDGFSPTPRGSVIVEFWHDDLGYYYMHRGQRIDVPNPWSR